MTIQSYRGRIALFVLSALASLLLMPTASAVAASLQIEPYTMTDIDTGQRDSTRSGRYGDGYVLLIGGRPSCGNTRSAINQALSFSKTEYGRRLHVAVMDIDGSPSTFRSAFRGMGNDNVRFYSDYDQSNGYGARYFLQYQFRRLGYNYSSYSLPYVILVKRNYIVATSLGSLNLSSFVKRYMTLDKPPSANTSDGPLNVYRMYNQYTGEHLYTTSNDEAYRMWDGGWIYEGVSWKSPRGSSTPVYRLYNPYSGDHHYTSSEGEYRQLQSGGWRGEGTVFYSAASDGVPVYRLFNFVNKGIGTHHYTTSRDEVSKLTYAKGRQWNDEGVGWYGAR